MYVHMYVHLLTQTVIITCVSFTAVSNSYRLWDDLHLWLIHVTCTSIPLRNSTKEVNL